MTGSALHQEVDALLSGDWEAEYVRRVAEIRRRIEARRTVLLFGAGYLGRHVLEELKDSCFEPVAFVDNDPERWGSSVGGLLVVSPAEALTRYDDEALWLITVYTNSAVIAQCSSLGAPWVTCAEFAAAREEVDGPSFDFGRPEALLKSAAHIRAVADIWADPESEAEYLGQVKWRFTLDYTALKASRNPSETYFPKGIYRRRDDDVFVDCGAFTGDTIQAFLDATKGRFRLIVAVEPDAVNARSLRHRMDAWKLQGVGPMIIEECAAGSHEHKMRFATTGTAGSSLGTGADLVRVRPLDDILDDRTPTFIKLDVEGAEKDALLGARRTIERHAPVMAVCLYHRPSDLWELPLLLRSMNPRYSLYLRRYSDECWETICYAVPPDRIVLNRS
jgi:FkbM family methyltransferase